MGVKAVRNASGGEPSREQKLAYDSRRTTELKSGGDAEEARMRRDKFFVAWLDVEFQGLSNDEDDWKN